MKNIHFITTLGIAAMLTVACGTQKTAVDKNYYKNPAQAETAIPLTESEKYAMAMPGKRCTGVGESFTEAMATNLAELNARENFSNALSAAIISASKSSSIDLGKYAADKTDSESVHDGSTRAKAFAQSISNNVVSNTNVVMKDKFKQQNGRYKIYVCLEYRGELAELANQTITEIKQRISDEDQAKLNEEHDELEKEIKEELQNKLK